MSAELIHALEDTLARPACQFLRIDRSAASELLAILKPQAREDAQPVAWMRITSGQVTDLTWIERPGYRPLYFAPPAPEAETKEQLAKRLIGEVVAEEKLRAAVEALEPFAKAAQLFDTGKYTNRDASIYRPAAGDDFSLHSGHLLDAAEAAACIREMVDLVSGFVQAEDDARSNPIGGLSLGGLMDCRDNSGCVYQSAHLAGLIEKARLLPLPPAPGAEA